MDRQTLTALLLVLCVFYVWNWDRTQRLRAAAEEAALTEQVDPGTPATPATPAAPEAPVAAHTSADAPVRQLPVAACGFTGQLSTEGGVLRDITLPNHPGHAENQPIWNWALSGFPAGWQPWGEDPGPERLASAQANLLAMGVGEPTAPSPRTHVLEEGEGRFVVEGVTGEGIAVKRTATVTQSDPCVLVVEASWTNRGASAYAGPLWLAMHDQLRESVGYYDNAIQPFGMVDGYVVTPGTLGDLEAPALQEGPVSWFGMSDRYFAAIVLPSTESTGRLAFTFRDGVGAPVEGQAVPTRQYGHHFVVSPPGGLAPGATHTERFRLFIGPKDLGLMQAVDPSLVEFVKYDYGWFAAIAFPLLWLLRFFHGWVGNWGLAIIALTVFAKGVFFPLTQMSFRSSQAMSALSPKLQELREKLKDNPEELNRQTIELFRTAGVNPLGGCLPMLVQMPVWFALYRVLLNSVELYHTDFLYLKDLSAADPYGVLPIVVIIVMALQQQMMPTANMDPAQARMLKIMPVIFGIFFFTFPSGLVVYIFVNTVLTILQQWLIKRQFEVAGQPGLAAST